MKMTALATLFLLAALPAQAAPTVVELFESQGCSSCPPAIANVNALAEHPDVLALMFSVTYWDQLGWKDTFGRSDYTTRQVAYGRRFGDGAYTPEVVINGQTDLVGTDRRQLDNAVSRAAALPGPALSLNGGAVIVGTGSGNADIWLVRYDPRVQNVAIGAGENSGVTIAHKNVVRDMVRLGDWSGAAQSFVVPAGGDPAWRSAILVQAKNSGPILAALKL